MVADYEAGMSGKAVAEKYGVWSNAVYSLLDRRGVQRRENRRGYKGGKSARDGYILTLTREGGPLAKAMANGLCNGRYVLEHRLVMAEHLGRPLTPEEEVHHINGKRSDNRLENLQLRQTKHGSGGAYRCRDCGSVNIEPVSLGE